LLSFNTYCISCLFFSTMSNVEEVNPYHHLFHFLESCWLHTHILFQFLYSYFLHFIAPVRGCKNFSQIHIYISYISLSSLEFFSRRCLKPSKCLTWQNLKHPLV
jgi:hypothetical protein